MKMKEENYFPANCQNPFFLFWTFFRPKKVLCAGESYMRSEQIIFCIFDSCACVLHLVGLLSVL